MCVDLNKFSGPKLLKSTNTARFKYSKSGCAKMMPALEECLTPMLVPFIRPCFEEILLLFWSCSLFLVAINLAIIIIKLALTTQSASNEQASSTRVNQEASTNVPNLDRVVFRKSRVPAKLDAIVIGSGISGLICASLMAKRGKRVLVLESHYIVGGCLHSFTGKSGVEFDTGLHYVGRSMVEMLKMFPVSTGAVEFEQMGIDRHFSEF